MPVQLSLGVVCTRFSFVKHCLGYMDRISSRVASCCYCCSNPPVHPAPPHPICHLSSVFFILMKPLLKGMLRLVPHLHPSWEIKLHAQEKLKLPGQSHLTHEVKAGVRAICCLWRISTDSHHQNSPRVMREADVLHTFTGVEARMPQRPINLFHK